MKTVNGLLSFVLAAVLLLAVACSEDGDVLSNEAELNSPTSVNCPSSHPYSACGQCWTDAAQAASGGCTDAGDDSGDDSDDNAGGGGASVNCPSSHPFEACGQCWESSGQALDGGCSDVGNPGDDDNDPPVDNGECDMPNWDPTNTTCVQTVANGSGCLNSDGYFVSTKGVVSNPCNTRLAILDLEENLGIEIDDQFIEQSGYQGAVPPINPTITLADAKKYFIVLFGQQIGNEFGDLLDTNGDGILTRNEASMAKGSDPRQLLNLPVESGLATDDVLAYIGMYLGDGALDKYAGDLGPEVMRRMESVTRTWQPGRSATSARYLDNE